MRKAKIKTEPKISLHERAAFISVKTASEWLSVARFPFAIFGQGQLKRFKFGSRTLLRRDDVMGLVREVPATEIRHSQVNPSQKVPANVRFAR